MRKLEFFRYFIAICFALTSMQVRADAFIMTKAMHASTIAEIFITPGKAKVELEIGLNNIEYFKNLLPDTIYQKLKFGKQPWPQRINVFFNHDFVLSVDGKPLPAKILSIGPRDRIKRDPITGEVVIANSKMKSNKVIFATLEYKFVGKPEAITIKPPLKNKTAITEIGFIAYHNGLHVNDFRYLGREETLSLNWQDPWHSSFASKNLKRKYKQPLSAFLYIEPFEVRKEIIIRPLDIQKYWLDLGLENKQTISKADKAQIKQKITDFLATKNPVVIDGRPVAGKLERVQFIRRTLNKALVEPEDKNIPIASTTLGVIVVYPTNGLPQKVDMTWELFNDDIPAVFSSATDEAGALPYLLTSEDPTLTWKNFLRKTANPSLIALQTPEQTLKASNRFWFIKKLFKHTAEVNHKNAHIILLGLLKNIYHAFDYREESDIYDILTKSVTGDLLTDIYLETQRSLRLKEQGGAKVRVKDIKIISEDITNLNQIVGFKVKSMWHVLGSIGHWGHIHQRKNQYEAIITVKAIDGAWKITEFEMLDEHRL